MEKRKAIQELQKIEKNNRRRQWGSIAWASISGAFVLLHLSEIGNGGDTFNYIMIALWLSVLALWAVIFHAQGRLARDCRREAEKWERLH